MEDTIPETLCHAEKLQRIFAAFADGRLPKDDTMIKKLEENLQSTLKDNETLSSSLVQYAHMDTVNETVRPQSMAFFLLATSYVQLNKQSDLCHQILRLFETASGIIPWKHAVVRCAWFRGLQNLTRSAAGKIVKWIFQATLLQRMLSGLTDSSLFVSKAAIELISLWISMDSSSIPIDQKKIFEDLQDHLWCSFNQNDQSVGYIYLKIIQTGMCFNKAELTKDTSKQQVMDKIQAVLSVDVQDAERIISVDILKSYKSVLTKKDVENFEHLVDNSIDSGDVKTAMWLAGWLLESHKSQVDDVNHLETIVFIVLSSVCDQNPPSDHHHSRILDQKKFLSSFVLTQLEVIKNYQEHSDIPMKHLQQLVDLYSYLQLGTNSVKEYFAGKKTKIKCAVIDTFNYIFKQRPVHQDRKLLVTMTEIIVKEMSMEHPYLLMNKILEFLLTSLVHLSLTVAGDEKHSTERNSEPRLDSSCDLLSEHKCVLTVWVDAVNAVDCLLDDPKWEVVDSATEFLSHILLQTPEPFLTDRSLPDSVFQKVGTKVLRNLQHEENYLKASSLKCISAMMLVPRAWAHITDIQDKDAFLKCLISIVKDDDEAFSRRSAVQALHHIFYLPEYDCSQREILTVMSDSMNDLDWEVKVNVSDFWADYIKKIVPSAQAGSDNCCLSFDVWSTLVDSGCLMCLLQAAVDCDKRVQEKSCLILRNLKSRLPEGPPHKRDKLKHSDWNESGVELHNLSQEKLLKQLEELDLESLLSFARESTDQYEVNSEALIDDILHTVMSAEDNESAPEDFEEENAVDCY